MKKLNMDYVKYKIKARHGSIRNYAEVRGIAYQTMIYQLNNNMSVKYLTLFVNDLSLDTEQLFN